MGDGTEPIEDEELLYRRIPTQVSYFDPKRDSRPSPHAFTPHRNDASGISFSRAKYASPEEVAMRGFSSRYWIAVLKAGDLRKHGLEVIARPVGGDPGHAELPALSYKNHKTDVAEETKVLLAEKLCLNVLGPFPSVNQV